MSAQRTRLPLATLAFLATSLGGQLILATPPMPAEPATGGASPIVVDLPNPA